jgi:hypothetical protein
MHSCSRSAAGVCATVWLGLAGLGATGLGAAAWNRFMSPQPDSAKPAHNSATAAQRRRLNFFSRRPAPTTSATRIRWSDELIPAKQLNLPHPEHLNSGPAARLDEAADANPPILEGLKGDSRGLENGQHAP